MRRLVLRLWDGWFGREIAEVEEAAEQFRTSGVGKRPDRKTVWVLLVAAVALTGQNFWQQFVPVTDIGRQFGLPWEFASLLAFALGCMFWYAVPAVLVIKLVFRERVTDYGVKLAGWSSGWKIYLVFVAVMVPLVLVFSGEPTFQRIYPFYRGWSPEADGWGRLLAWEVAYALQFVALEFFFRGFLVHGLKHRFGVYSVFVMTVPYCMIHFGKALPECLASIIAGVALGLMSLKTRSVWLGAALHISVAWGMDTCSLWRKGLLG
jgi:membrane protease YdiL (CAAX protease family)